jgi:hypothetical protein
MGVGFENPNLANDDNVKEERFRDCQADTTSISAHLDA